jgi:hypothetical protein
VDNPQAPSVVVPTVGGMPRFSVDPDDLTAAGAVAEGAAETLRAVAAGVVAAGRSVATAAGAESAEVMAAFGAYVGVDATTAAALGEAVTLLGRALDEAGSAYTAAERAVGAMAAGSSP